MEESDRRTWLASVALVAVTLLLLTWFAWSRRWMSDDGFIYLRVVQNVRAGHGPVFNAGERVEAATGPAWVAVLAFFDLTTPFRLEWIAVVLGIVCTVGGCAAAAMAAVTIRRDVLRDHTLFVPFGLAVVVAVPAVWDYATSGLETGLAFAWIGVTFLLLARWVANPKWRTTAVPFRLAVAVGFGSLVRPDLMLFTLTFGALLLVPRVDPRPNWQRFRVVAVALFVPAAYEVFRAGYYGALVPNTAFAKEGSTLRVSQGIRYAKDFVNSYWLFVPALLATIVLVALLTQLWRAHARGAAAVVVACVAAGLLDALYTIAIGGSHMHARLFLPSLLACLAPIAVIPWAKARLVVLGVLVWSAVCVVSLRPPRISETTSASGFSPATIRYGIVDLRTYFTVTTHHRHPVTIQSHMDAIPAVIREVESTPNGKVSLPWWGLVGANAYYNGPSVYTFDDLGLADWLTARLPLDTHKFPDHQKFTGLWLNARMSEVTGEPPPAGDSVTAAALHALDCGDLRDLREAATAHLSVHRFFSNIGVALKLRSFRVAQDPRVAERDLCAR